MLKGLLCVANTKNSTAILSKHLQLRALTFSRKYKKFFVYKIGFFSAILKIGFSCEKLLFQGNEVKSLTLLRNSAIWKNYHYHYMVCCVHLEHIMFKLLLVHLSYFSLNIDFGKAQIASLKISQMSRPDN